MSKHIRIIPIQGDLGELVDQAIAARRPFRSEKGGFRDAIIWINVLEMAKEDRVLLISHNSKDFAGRDKGTLHEHLREDIATREFSLDRIRLIDTLRNFIESEVPREDRDLIKARELLKENEEWAKQLQGRVESALREFVLENSDYVSVVGLTDAYINNEAVEAVGLKDLEIIAAYETDIENKVILEIHAHTDMDFTFSTDDFGKDALSYEGADVDLEELSETTYQGWTQEQPVVVIYDVDFNPETYELGDIEKDFAEDDY